LSKHIGLIVFLAIAILASILFFLDLKDSVVIPLLSSSLNIIFRVGAFSVVAFISARSYLKNGSFQLLLIGSSMVAFAVGALLNVLGSLLAVPEWLNFALSIINISFFVFAALNILAAGMLFFKRSIFRPKPAELKLNLLLGYISAVVLIVVLGWMVYAGIIPPFAIGREYTFPRYFALIGALALFLISTLVIGKVYFESKSKVLYWYTLALGLHVVSVSALLLAPGAGTALSWWGSVAQCLGSVFFIIGLLSGFRTPDIVNSWNDAFKRDKRQFSQLFSHMNMGFAYCKMIFDQQRKPIDYVFLEVNDAFEEFTGLKRSDVLNRKVTDIIPGIEKDPADWIGTYGKVVTTGKPAKFENYSEFLKRWYLVSAYSPESGYFAATFIDISDRKKAEEALSKLNEELEERIRQRTEQVSSERQRLYNVLETLPAYVILLDKDYCVPFANKVFRDRFGESRGRRCYDFLFQRESPCENCESYKVLKTSGPHRWEWTGPDGRDYDIYDFPFVESDGSTIILEMGIDITERKRAEKQIRDASLYARSLLEASLDPLVTINAEGKITDVNQATELATGYSRDELIGSDFSDYFTDAEKARIGYKQVFTEGYVRDYPLAIRHKSGKTTEVLYNATIYTNEAGEMQGVFAAARDITELRKAEAQAQEAERKLRDAERLAAIGATAGMVGHDIRNPLQAITSDVYLAKVELASVPDAECKANALESLTEIEKNISYINKIVQDLQDYARPLNPAAKEIDLQSLIEDLIKKNGSPEEVKVSVKIQKEAASIVADPEIIRRVLANLVTNALQAMPEGGKLTIRTTKEADDTVITVQDTGVGIPQEVRAKLFTPLFTTKSKGQGFGLAVVKRMIEAMNGTITFESEIGNGTKFILRLPPPRQKR
jgi:PAS domain S-box-containing protein